MHQNGSKLIAFTVAVLLLRHAKTSKQKKLRPDVLYLLFRTSQLFRKHTEGKVCALKFSRQTTRSDIYYLQKQDPYQSHNPLREKQDEPNMRLILFSVVSTVTFENESNHNVTFRDKSSNISVLQSENTSVPPVQEVSVPCRAQWALSSSKRGFNLRRGFEKNVINKVKMKPAGRNPGNCGSFANASQNTRPL